MDTKTCSVCKMEKHINTFYKRYTEYKVCNRTRGLNHYFDNKDKTSNKQKIHNEKNREKIILQKQSKRCKQFRDLVISHDELENRIK